MSETAKNTTKTGNLGENVAQQYLQDKGYTVLATNYLKKWGKVDIVARKGTMIHFVEVKTFEYETKGKLEWAVTHETWRPEELVDDRKLHQIEKALETWLSENKYQGEWVIDVIAVRMVPHETYATVNFIENVVK